MADFIHGKIPVAKLNDMYLGLALIPNEPIQFTPAAKRVMEAGREIWHYYLHHNDDSKDLYGDDINVNASFYDIREYFQGRDENGRMNNESDNMQYNALMDDLRAAQKVLAKQIEKKVYLYGFLKGEVTYDQKELLSENMELKKKIQALEHQQAQQGSNLVNYGTVNIYEH